MLAIALTTSTTKLRFQYSSVTRPSKHTRLPGKASTNITGTGLLYSSQSPSYYEDTQTAPSMCQKRRYLVTCARCDISYHTIRAHRCDDTSCKDKRRRQSSLPISPKQHVMPVPKCCEHKAVLPHCEACNHAHPDHDSFECKRVTLWAEIKWAAKALRGFASHAIGM